MFLNNLFAFGEGFALILSPCILPILPILFSGGISGGRKRPLGILFGFVITFASFTAFSHVLVESLNLNLTWVRNVAFILIALFGLILISDVLSAKFSVLTNKIANWGNKLSAKQEAKTKGFWGGIVLGALVSLVWVPCGGPILASAIIQIVIQKTLWASFITFFFFALGSIIPMLCIILLGRTIMNRFNFLNTKTELIRKVFGGIMIIMAMVSIFFNPFAIAAASPMSEAPNVTITASMPKLVGGLAVPYQAPMLNDPANAWINSPPLTLAQLKGKVVLIDFWTYSCINCVRTLPYLKDWYSKYERDGLVIIGVHAPEFAFEKDMANVQAAVKEYGILYPVVLDNDYGTWQNYNNQYWPADYLIDKNGNVVYEHFGEGGYNEAEQNIRTLLGLAGAITPPSSAIIAAANAGSLYNQTPETYLGYGRADSFNSREGVVDDVPTLYSFPTNLPQDTWALQGKWNVAKQYIQAMANNASIEIHFYARKLFLVAGTVNNTPTTVQVSLNNKPMPAITIEAHTLYSVLTLDTAQKGILQLTFPKAGVQLYTFTFGG